MTNLYYINTTTLTFYVLLTKPIKSHHAGILSSNFTLINFQPLTINLSLKKYIYFLFLISLLTNSNKLAKKPRLSILSINQNYQLKIYNELSTNKLYE